MKKILATVTCLAVCFSAASQTAAFKRSGTNLPFASGVSAGHVINIDRGGGLPPANLTYGVLESQIRTNVVNAATNLVGELPASFTNVVVFSARADGVAGDGRAARPLDASTPAKFHAAWNAVLGTPRKNLEVIFLPGRYFQTNELRFENHTNVVLSGYGATLALSNQNLTVGISQVAGGTNYACTVKGLTFDSGTLVVSTNIAITCGLLLGGDKITYRDVHVFKTHAPDLNYEAFGLWIIGNDNVIQNCRVDSPATNCLYMSAITMVGMNGKILGNQVDLRFPGSETNTTVRYFGISPYLSRGVVANNSVYGATSGLSCDNAGGWPAGHTWSNTLVSANYINSGSKRPVPKCVRLLGSTNSQIYADWTFSGNTFEASVDTALWLAFESGAGVGVRNLRLNGNTFIGGGNRTILAPGGQATNIIFSGNFYSAPALWTVGRKLGTDFVGLPSTFHEREEFLSGAGTGGVASGTHTWGQNNATLTAHAAFEADHPGTVDFACGASATSFSTLQLMGSSAFGGGVVEWGQKTNWRHRFVFKLLSTNSVFAYVGLVVNNVASTATTPTGFFLRLNSGATQNFRFVTYNGTAETDLDTGVVGDTNWHTLEISSTTVGVIDFQLDGGTVQSISSNIATSGLRVAFQIGTGEAVAKTIRADMWDCFMEGLNR